MTPQDRKVHAASFTKNVQQAFTYMTRNLAYYRGLDCTFGGEKSITFVYEHLQSDFSAEMSRVLEFLKASPHEYPNRLKALNVTPHETGIKNWDEVYGFFSRYIFSDLFHASNMSLIWDSFLGTTYRPDEYLFRDPFWLSNP